MTKAVSGAPGGKANHLLGGNAIDSHRIFISTFIQHSTYAHCAAGDLLAGRLGAFSKTDDWTRVRKKALPIYFGPGFKDFTFDYYAATQCLASRSGPTVDVFRGIPRNTAQLLFDDLARPGLTAHLFLDVLSSDRAMEAAMTAFFVAGPLGGIVGGIVGARMSRRAPTGTAA